MEKYNLVFSEQEIAKDIELSIHSAYGGANLGCIKVSEADELIANQPDKAFGVDYFFRKC